MHPGPEHPPHIKMTLDKAAYDLKKGAEGSVKHIPVKITGIDIPFGQLVWFLVNLSFAAVPAAIIVMIFWATASSFIFGALSR